MYPEPHVPVATPVGFWIAVLLIAVVAICAFFAVLLLAEWIASHG